MSDWRRKQGPARFRGAPFFVDSGEHSGGRRVVGHEFPLSEDPPYSEDLGKRGRKFQVEGYVLGTDYTTARDALLTALETPGPGELVHPQFGTRRVAVADFRVRESRGDGGIATFSISFLETSSGPTQPVTVVDARVDVDTRAQRLKNAAGEQFLAAFTVLPAFASSTAAACRAVAGAIDGVINVQALGAQEAAGLRRLAANMAADAASLATAPASLLAAQIAIFEALAAALATAATTLSPSATLLTLYGLHLGDRPPASTDSRATEQANYDATQRLTQRLALAFASAAIVGEVFASYDEALTARSAIVDLIDLHVDTVSDDTFPILNEVRVSLVLAVPGADLDLPKLQTTTPAGTVPSLVLAHRLYGSVALEADLIARNKVRNPGFIAGGTALEVLAHG